MAGGIEKLRRDLRRMARKSRRLRGFYYETKSLGRRFYLGFMVEIARFTEKNGEVPAGGVGPESMVWVFGSGRSGSTWVRSIMSEMDGHRIWEEPMVGKLFGEFHARADAESRRSAGFILGDSTRKGWRRAIRNFVLEVARYSFPRLGPGEYLVVKEPNGSIGAPLLMEALPESRMVLLIRDPRDVISSVLDASKKGGWLRERWDDAAEQPELADEDPDGFVKSWAAVYRDGVGNALRAYRVHPGPKALVKYEDLVDDTHTAMSRLYCEIGVPYSDAQLVRAMEKFSWASIPEAEKGPGKFFRKGEPGGWREDLTPEQVSIVEEANAPILREFYPSS